MKRGKSFFVCMECGERAFDQVLHPTSDFALSQLEALPFPVAYPLAHALNPVLCPSASDRLDNLIFAAQQAIRLSALLLLADYLSCDTKCRELDAPIRSLRMPHWREWSSLTDKLSKFWKGHWKDSEPERVSHFGWLPDAWGRFANQKDPNKFGSDVLSSLPGLEGPARTLNDALCKARNDAAHRRTTRSSVSSHADLEVLEKLLPLFSEAVGALFPTGCFLLQRRVSLDPLQIVTLEGAHLDLRFTVQSLPQAWRSVFEANHVIAVLGDGVTAVPLHPLVVSLDPETESEIFGGSVTLEPAALLDQVASKQVVVLGVKTFRDRGDLLDPFRQAIQKKQVAFGMGRLETTLWTLAEWSRESARLTLEELRGRKYFPDCYVERAGVENVVESLLTYHGRALLLLGEAGSGKSSLISRLVDNLTAEPGLDIEKKGKEHDGELSLKNYLESRGGRDVVIFLSGRAAFGGDAGHTGRTLLCEAVMQKAGIRSGTFKDLEELMVRLGETTGDDQNSNRKVWLIFDGVNEADRFTDLLAALDEFLPSLTRHQWLRLVVSIRSGAYEALDRRHTLYSQAGPGVFANERYFFSFLDERSNKEVPYLTLRSFTKEEGGNAYRLRVKKLPNRSAGFAWESLSPAVQELLFSPLHLHLFHETYRLQDAMPNGLGEDTLFSAYLEHLSSETPGLLATITSLGRYMYEHRTPVLPVEIADTWITEWRKGVHSSTAAAKLDPIEELVSASLLMRPTEEGLGADRKLVAFQFSHQKMCEQVLLLELQSQVRPRKLPTGEELMAWVQKIAGSSGEGAEPFKELLGAVQNSIKDIITSGAADLFSALFFAEPEEVRSQVILGGILNSRLNAQSKELELFLIGLREYTKKAPEVSKKMIDALSDPLKRLAHRGHSLVERSLLEVCRDISDLYSAEKSQDLEYAKETCGYLNRLGELYVQENRMEIAHQQFSEAIQTWRRWLERMGSHNAVMQELSESIYRLADLYEETGNSMQSRILFEEAFSIQTSLIKSNPHDKKINRDLAACLGRLGKICKQEGNLVEALFLFEKSHSIRRNLAETEPEIEDLRDLSVSVIRLAQVHAKKKNYGCAGRHFEEAINIRRFVLSEEPHRSDFKKNLSFALHVSGKFQENIGKIDFAYALTQEALEIRRHLSEAEPHRTDLKRQLSNSLRQLGEIVLKNGKFESAHQFFDESLSIKRALLACNTNTPGLPNEIAVLERALAKLESTLSAGPSEARGEHTSVYPRLL